MLDRKVSARPSVLPPLPTLIEVEPPNNQPAALLGDKVTVLGFNLTGVTSVLLKNSRLGVQQPITTLTNAGASSFQFTVNIAPSALPAGVYTLSAQMSSLSGIIETNSLPLMIAPQITLWPSSVTPDAQGNAKVNVTCSPFVWPGQEVYLLIGGQAAPADAFSAPGGTPTPTGTPSFTSSSLKPTATPMPLRLRVDGIDSPIINMTASPPIFTGPSVEVS